MQTFALALALALATTTSAIHLGTTTTSAINLGTKGNYSISLGDIDECIEWEVIEVFEGMTFQECEE